jgi:hypothetical protein
MEEAKFYVYIQSTTMERPDLERAMEQVLLLLLPFNGHRQLVDYSAIFRVCTLKLEHT